MMTVLFWVSLSIIVAGALYVVLAPCVPGGAVSATFVGGSAVFALAGFDQSPPNWLVGFTVCQAGAVLWAGARWYWYQHRDTRDWLKRLENL